VNDADLGSRIVTAVGAGAARELLEVLERSTAERAALIGRLYVREDARWLAEVLMDVEEDPVTRLELVGRLRSALD
jgi:hypothetical protein